MTDVHAHYERSYFFGQHEHILIMDTGEGKEFCDPRIQHIKKTIEKRLGSWSKETPFISIPPQNIGRESVDVEN